MIEKSKNQTKEWRINQEWYNNGKSNECELFQRKIFEIIINKKCVKSNIRINIKTNELHNMFHPMKLVNGFDFTEDFDGTFTINNNNFFVNFKFVCGNGGAQTRTLREVYYFIKYQLLILEKSDDNLFFINILDGDNCYKHMNKFEYLLKEYNKNNIFIGDMNSFNTWFNNFNKKLI